MIDLPGGLLNRVSSAFPQIINITITIHKPTSRRPPFLLFLLPIPLNLLFCDLERLLILLAQGLLDLLSGLLSDGELRNMRL
jgi:hypothetical protein